MKEKPGHFEAHKGDYYWCRELEVPWKTGGVIADVWLTADEETVTCTLPEGALGNVNIPGDFGDMIIYKRRGHVLVVRDRGQHGEMREPPYVVMLK